MWEGSRPPPTVSCSRIASAGVANHILFLVWSEGPFGKIDGYHGEGVHSGGKKRIRATPLAQG